MWVIYRDKHKGGPLPASRLYLDIENFNSGITFAWSVYRGKVTSYFTKLEAETAAIQFSARHPEFLGQLKTTWTQKRLYEVHKK